jgi:hypothetical protein
MYLRMVPDLEVERGGRESKTWGGGRDIVSRVLVDEPRCHELARAG